jgi:hypothetical protein
MMKIVSALLLLTVGFAAADDGEFELFPILRCLGVELLWFSTASVGVYIYGTTKNEIIEQSFNI